MTLRKKVANALSFAHLTGFAKADEPNDERDRRDDAEDDDPEKKDQDRENGDSKKGKKAEDKKDDDSAQDDEPEKNDDDDKKAKSKAEDDDDSDAEDEDDKDDEMHGKSAAAAARRRERARCAAIFGTKAAGKNPALAANLAFNTRMTRKEAIVVLESTPAAGGFSGRSARNPNLGTGAALPSSKQAVASNWDAAFKKVAPRR
jgi:hypothetical protein